MKRKSLKRMLLRLNAEPEAIASGLSLGVIVGMTPFWGVQTYIVLLLATFLRCNHLAALLGIQITNILTAPFIYALTFRIGSWFYPANRVFDFSQLLTIDAMRQLFGSLRFYPSADWRSAFPWRCSSRSAFTAC